jgi:F0F1-type ATP synthase epsilon subunit
MASSDSAVSDEVMTVKVFSPREVYYEGPAQSFSAENDTGKFDILPLHHSFISLLKAGKIIIGLHNDQQKILDIEKGLLRVRDNKVTVFLDV